MQHILKPLVAWFGCLSAAWAKERIQQGVAEGHLPFAGRAHALVHVLDLAVVMATSGSVRLATHRRIWYPAMCQSLEPKQWSENEGATAQLIFEGN